MNAPGTTIQTVTVNKFAARFERVHLPSRDLSGQTMADYHNKLRVISDRLGNAKLPDVSTRDVAVFLDGYPPAQRNRYRSLLVLMFRYAQNDGLITVNPAQPTIPMKERVKRKRLTIEEFWAVHETAPAFVQKAMRVALRTLQRREDLVSIRLSDIKDGCIHVIQKKTGSAIRIRIDDALAGDIQPGDGWLLHYANGRQLPVWALTNGFRRARDRHPMFTGAAKGELPSFHEIRALGAISYLESGKPIGDIQKLLGHKTMQMTMRYLERHGIQFVDAETGPFAANIEAVLHGGGGNEQRQAGG